ncbi:immunity 52 family protein [Pseudoduganella sp. HUAS MS19]
MTRPIEITTTFRHPGNLKVEEQVGELYALLPYMLDCSPLLNPWLLKGKSKEDAQRYIVFDADGAATAGIAVLAEDMKKDVDPRIVGVWNGRDDAEGASLQYVSRPAPQRSMVVLRAKPKAFTDDWHLVADLIKGAVAIWQPAMVSVEPFGYFDHKVFKDRPGAGWMLYLPKVLTAREVPEARALLPVMGTNAKGKQEQIGTIIVSVIDDVFSLEDPDHLNIANSIEVRLVDQDLLPNYAEL